MRSPNAPRAITSIAAIALLLAFAAPVAGFNPDTEVTVGSPSTPFSQNKQNEPGIAVNPIDTQVLVAGANDNIDMEACNAAKPTDCPFTAGVGVSGVSFSLDGGDTWVQPNYTGYSARNCLGDPDPTVITDVCVPDPEGPIGTLPWYSENSLVSNGDPILAFGPVPGNDGTFSWDNGARLYYANITTNLNTDRTDGGFKGQGAIGVSRTDDVAAAAAGGAAGKAAWMPPVIVTKQSSAVFQDKEALWVDNAASSDFFGNVYVCNVEFRSIGGAPEPVFIARSTDGGDTWTQQQITQAANAVAAGRAGGRQGCTIRTDSHGTVYVFWSGSLKGTSVQYLSRSFDGGLTFESFRKVRAVATVVEVGALDPVQGRNTMDGVAGARSGSSFPTVDIANGAPSGADAPDTIVLAWPDGQDGLNHERVLVQESTDRGATWSTPATASAAGDRPDFAAIAISPDGSDVYLTYTNHLDPWRLTTAEPRRMQGVVRHGTGTLTNWTDLHRGAVGDNRGSSANALADEFLGDYNYAVATNDFGAAVWTDVRNAAVCDAIDTYRQSLVDGAPIDRPAPQQDCDPQFGNTDIFGGTYADPTP
ncbi:MAG: sialidase family protein [Candidatus Limnocylindrales bacterium]